MFKLASAMWKQLSPYLDESYANEASSVVLGIVGATLFIAPDYFWNPEDGVLPIPELVGDEELDHHFDLPTKMFFRFAGANMLSAALYHMFLLQDGNKGAEERAFLRYKMVLFASHFALMLHTAFFNPHTGTIFDEKSVILMALIKAFFVVWLAVALARSSHPQEPTMKGFSTGSFSLLLCIAYSVPFAIVMLLSPEAFYADGVMPYINERPSALLPSAYTMADGSNVLQDFASRYAGASLLPSVAALLDLSTVPLHVVQRQMVGLSLYAILFAVGLTDQSGFLSKKAYGMQLLTHLLVSYFVWKLANMKKTSVNASRPSAKVGSEKNAVKGQKEKKAEVVPSLSYEKGHKKIS